MTVDAVVANKTAIGGAAFAALFILERMFSAAPGRGGLSRLTRNGVLWLSLLALSPLVALPLSKFAGANPLWTRPSEWPAWVTLAIDIVLLDLWAYFVHRAYHQVPLLRRFHRVHHLDQHLDSTTAVRFHPGEVAISALLRLPPIVLLAVPFPHVVIYETALLVGSFFHHSNVRVPQGIEAALSRVFVTPSIHWVHHHADPSDTNSNYSAVLSLWDRVFRTASRTRRTPGTEIGLQGVADKSAGGLLLLPFQAVGDK